ncbi:zinc finger protein 267-like isoform X2 [Agrilus planipennis]|uniref:Zinc finger protein 267-like isoform X2 n=1 Tax=Agrilus planipennis TaxID=224129 RepID=A0A1W4WTM6_AGRPL|nr:zinc finger protein 267-like isoform X2 [Agrilus planipennis]
MCGVQLECPLCCKEVFSTYSALKNHLIQISQQLKCEICGLQFEKLRNFADHIGSECKLNCKSESSEFCELQEELNSKEITLDHEVLCGEPEVSKQDSNSSENLKSDELYHCSTCDINFTSVEEHIQEYHKGHEVFLEAPIELDKPLDSENYATIVSEESILGLAGLDDDIESQIQCSTIKKNYANDIKEGVYVDKNGRAYTRKMVKIEKFWHKEGKSREQHSPIVEQGYDSHKCHNEKCQFCDCYFSSTKSLCAHMRVHKGDNKQATESTDVEISGSFICNVCNTEFQSYKSLKLHSRMHDPVKLKEIEPPVSYGVSGETQDISQTARETFVCNVCNNTYDKKYEKVHTQSHSLDENFNCEICNKKFYTRENLTMHARVHVGVKKFSCSYCKKPFLTYESLHEHVTSQCQKRQYECQFCGRRFARPHEKVKHERIHTGEKPHICQICGKAFRVSYCLTLHLRTHSGTRPYQCPHCGKRFKAHSVYNHHLLTHSDERKYKCPYCPKAFKTGVQLAGHKNSHTKPFTCTECNRPFASLYAVRIHMDTHQRENNLKHKCWVCGASYARAFALKDHIKEQHQGGGELADLGEEFTEQDEGNEVVEQEILIEMEESGQNEGP